MLNGEIMERYTLAKDWRNAGFYETENHRQIARAVRAGLGSGRLIAITGPIGVGKTVFLRAGVANACSPRCRMTSCGSRRRGATSQY